MPEHHWPWLTTDTFSTIVSRSIGVRSRLAVAEPLAQPSTDGLKLWERAAS